MSVKHLRGLQSFVNLLQDPKCAEVYYGEHETCYSFKDAPSEEDINVCVVGYLKPFSIFKPVSVAISVLESVRVSHTLRNYCLQDEDGKNDKHDANTKFYGYTVVKFCISYSLLMRSLSIIGSVNFYVLVILCIHKVEVVKQDQKHKIDLPGHVIQ